MSDGTPHTSDPDALRDDASESRAARLRRFDEQTERIREHNAGRHLPPAVDRGWTRDDLYVGPEGRIRGEPS